MSPQIRRRSVVVTGLVLAVTALVALFLTLLRAQAGGPDAAYAFSEGAGTTAADMSGNGNSGTLVNGPVWAAAGRYGYALMFDGVNDGVELPVSPTLALTTAFTLEAWVRPTADSGLARQIVQMGGANGDGLRLSGDGRPRFRALFPAGSIEVTGPSSLPIDAWTHLGVTYDGALLRLYVDGSQVATQAASGAVSGTQAMWLGRTRSGGSPFGGLLDEIRIYRRTLAAGEVLLDLSTPIDPATPFQVTTVSPRQDVTGVISTPVTATFSRPVNAATVTSSTFVLLDATQSAVPATVSYTAVTRTATLTPDGPLAPLAIYTAGVRGDGGGVTDSTGAELASDVEWSFTTAASETLPSAAYAFSEGSGTVTADVSGNGHTGTLVNGPVWTPSGQFGSALIFDGLDDEITLPVSDALKLTTAFTLEAWVQPTLTNGVARQIVQAAGESGDGLRLTGNGRPRFTAAFPGGVTDVTGPAALPIGAWSHVAVTYDGTTLRLFVGGAQVATRAVTGGISGSQRLGLGRTRAGNNPFVGLLDEIRIYRRALSASDIALDVNTPVDETNPFQVSGMTPAANAVGVVTTPVTATFSRAANEATVTDTSFILLDSAQSAVPVTVGYDVATRTATLTPSTGLAPLATYTARVRGGSSGVTDSTGTELAGDVEWSFQTAADDTVPSAAYAFSEESGPVTADATGNGHTGTLVADPVRTTAGQFGNALIFDGVDDGVALPTSDALTFTSAFTVEAWVQPAVETASARQIVQMPGAGGDGLRLTINGRPRFRATLPGGTVNVTGASALPLNVWTHVAATYDGAALRVYVNGSEAATLPVTGDVTGRFAMSVGRTRLGGNPFLGLLDEIRIYRRALTAGEIVTDMNTPLDTPVPQPVSIAVAPAGASITTGTTYQFTATATFADESTSDVTTSAAWTTSNEAAATVSAGLATGAGPGPATLTAAVGSVTGSAELRVVNADTPPTDPAILAPPANPTVIASFHESNAFLFTGPDAVQRNVAPGTIEPQRAAVIRGKVTTRDGSPLAGVIITVVGAPEYGSTASRDDGMFDLAVNGSNGLTITYTKTGFLPAQRQVDVPWGEFAIAADAALVPLDTQVTTVDLSAATPIHVARGSIVTDEDGTRRATVLFRQGTAASLMMPDGSTQPITTLHIRATEYTVGPGGEAAMPAVLPPTSSYTYAAELSADEAMAAGATSVQFSAPVPVYVENFLGFAVGTPVPSGYYDRAEAAWIAADNGVVIRILGTDGTGRADVDSNGDGQADDDASLTALGMNDDERRGLASTYASGQSLWRMPVTHFTPWDFNYWTNPSIPPGTIPAEPSIPPTNAEPEREAIRCGSIVECQSQTLGEVVPISGTPFSLTYRSDRSAGRASRRSVDIALTGDTVPGTLQSIEVRAKVAGRTLEQTFAPAAGQHAVVNWDGHDAYGRQVFGAQVVDIVVSYAYEGVYLVPSEPRSFGVPGGTPTAVPSRTPAFRFFGAPVTLQGTPPPSTAVAGWNLSAHHIYDPRGQLLYRGDGRQVRAGAWGLIVNSLPAGVTGTLGGDGNFYRLDGGGLVRVHRDGSTEVVSTEPPSGVSSGAITLAAGPGEALYYAKYTGGSLGEIWDTLHVGRYSRAGVHTPLATIDIRFFMGNGSPTLTVANDGSVYVYAPVFGDRRIVRIGPGGGPAVTVAVAEGDVRGLAVGSDGALYWSEVSTNSFFQDFTGRIRRLLPSGVIELVGGNSVVGVANDGANAKESSLGPLALTLDEDGSVLFLNVSGNRQYGGQTGESKIRRIGVDGILSTIAGGPDGDSGDGGPAVGARFFFSESSVLSLGPDRQLYVLVNFLDVRMRKLSAEQPPANATAFTVAAEDGSEAYEFSLTGRHLRTRHALTGAVIYEFGYNAAGQLVTVTDGDGLVTRIERDDMGTPTAIVAPFGQRTVLTVDGNRYLATIANPGGGTTTLTTTSTGLLTMFSDANGHESTFTYDGFGRLVLDQDAAGGSQSLARMEVGNVATATLTTGLDRVYTYRVERPTTGEERLINTAPDGTSTTEVQGLDGTRTTTSADGMRTTITFAPDPRFGMAAAVPASAIVRTPAGVQMTATTTRGVSLTDPMDPLTLETQTETRIINGRTTQTVFDAATRTSTTTTPAGRTSTSKIDAQGRVTRTQVGTLTPVDFTYDPQGRLTTIAQGPRQSAISYDASGRPSILTDALSRSVTFGYDTADRVTTQTRPDTQVIGFTYDPNSNVTSLTPPGRPAHAFTYTPVDLTASYTPPVVAGTGPTQYTFNVDRQPTSLVRPDGQTTGFAYAANGRLTAVDFSRGALGYTYDAAGRVTALSDPSGVNLTFTYDGALPLSEAWSGPFTGAVSRTFTNNFELATEKVNGASEAAFGYDADRLLTQAGALTIARQADTGLVTGTTLSTTTEAFAYTTFGEPSRQTAQVGGTTVFDVQITRDALGRITQRIEVIDGITRVFEYGYDLAGRLSIVRRNGTLVVLYSYDANGNRLSAEGEAGLFEGTYDAQDRALTYGNSSYTYTANGELATKTVAGQTTSYVYDTLGNLLQVTKPTGTVITYTVDGRGRRVRKAVDGALVKGWLYADQLRPIAELDGSGAVVARFVYGTRPNVPEYVIKDGVTYRIFSDHLGSPRIVVNATTGAVVQRMDFQPFGEIIQDSSPGWQPFGFAGGLYDPDTGLVRSGARDYDPQMGRWTAKDPLAFDGGDVGLYAYVGGSPISNIDPYGLWRLPDYLALNINIAIPNPWTGTLVGWSGTAAISRHGDVFWSPLGAGIGKSLTFAAASITANWLDQGCTPSQGKLSDFLSANGTNFSAGFGGGVSQSYTPGSGFATGVGLMTPQLGVSYNYSFKGGNLGSSW